MINLTDSAVAHVRKLLEKEGIPSPPGGIRFLVKAGGCSGLELVYRLERQEDRYDIIVMAHGVRVFVDPKSMTQLKDSTIDHTDNLIDKNFTINNPGSPSCGCGTSFEPKK